MKEEEIILCNLIALWTLQNAFNILSHLSLLTVLFSQADCYPHFIGEETKAQSVLNDLPKVTQLLGSKVKTRTWIFMTPTFRALDNQECTAYTPQQFSNEGGETGSSSCACVIVITKGGKDFERSHEFQILMSEM